MCDLNQDGQIDYQEFIQAAIDHRSLLNKQNIELLFKMFDTDKDGNITIDELKAQFCN